MDHLGECDRSQVPVIMIFLSRKTLYADWESRRGLGCTCGSRFETLYLNDYLNATGVDVTKFKNDCERIIKINELEGDPCKRCQTAGGSTTSCEENPSNAIQACFCNKSVGGEEYLCLLDNVITGPLPYTYTNCADADTTSIKCRKLPPTPEGSNTNENVPNTSNKPESTISPTPNWMADE